MALVNCKECSKGISAKIKNCIHCGAPQKRRSIMKWIGMTLIAFLAFMVLVAIGTSENANSTGTPKCDSSTSIRTLKSAFDGSQYARAMKLSEIDITQSKEISVSQDHKLRNCSAEIALNNTENIFVDYKMEAQDNGKFMLQFEVKR
jgi:hypothetical protein